jgi:hypothetical protein
MDRLRREALSGQGHAAIDPWKLAHVRTKMKSHSYGMGGQDPRKLLKRFDRDGGGELDLKEFTALLRKGGHMTKREISDEELRQMFDSLDADGSGAVGIEELTDFVSRTERQESVRARRSGPPTGSRLAQAAPTLPGSLRFSAMRVETPAAV